MTGRQNGHLCPALPLPKEVRTSHSWGAPGLASGESEMLSRPPGGGLWSSSLQTWQECTHPRKGQAPRPGAGVETWFRVRLQVLEGNVGKRVWRHAVACLDLQENYHRSVTNTKAAGGRGLQREWWSLAPQHMSR